MKKKIARKAFVIAKSPLGDMIVGLAFGKFSKVLPVKRIKETDKVVAFWHPKPFWDKHILIVPKKLIKKITTIKKSDHPYINDCFEVAKEIVEELEWEKEGYSITINGGGRQEVNQLHFHLHSGNIIKSA